MSKSPEPEKISYLNSILNKVAPSTLSRATRPSRTKDQLALYLEESCIDSLGVMEYWRSREHLWPQLARMAFDFLAVPAMSSECERVFSSCAKQTTLESSRLTGILLWHQECLKNWQRQGAIQIGTA